MEILRFEGAPNSAPKARKRKSNLGTLAGLASVAAIAVLGSTLAANITLGSGSLEFGQGTQVTAACDSDITVTPVTSFTNASGGGVFMLSTISFSGFNAVVKSGGVGCLATTMTVGVYGDTAATPLQIATSGSTAVTTATFALTDSATATSTAGTLIGAYSGAAAARSFGLGLTVPSATAGAVYKITLQSS